MAIAITIGLKGWFGNTKADMQLMHGAANRNVEVNPKTAPGAFSDKTLARSKTFEQLHQCLCEMDTLI
ncbi:hypothetical protein CEXT_256391 [Caerostris extrusa]|uniref:Uncharacterized protein n=1 Tax=Caerostris extrusa TaxID=172846 RepID=A0AAV4M6E2_CAEEX|nr:hypothetical protein CEXT_256391 [Caerostris extrusa]